MRKIALVAATLLVVGCSKSRDAQPGTRTQPSFKEVPITSSSPQAIAAFKKGRQLLENVRKVEALEYMKRAVKLDPNFAMAHAYLGHLPGAEGEKHLAKAMALSKNLSEPEQLQIRMGQAQRRGDIYEAWGLLERLAKLVPNDWRIQLGLGSRAYVDHKWDISIAALRRSIALNSQAGEPYNMLAYSLAYQGKFDEAIAAVKKYVELKPKEPNPQDSLGEILMLAGRLTEAEAAFRRSAKIWPKFWMAWVGIATVRMIKSDWAGGRAALAKARVAAHSLGGKLKVDEMIASSYAAQGKKAMALKMLRAVDRAAVAQKSKRSCWTPVSMAWYWAEAGVPKEALRQAELALQRAKKFKLNPVERKYHRFFGNLVRIRALTAAGRLADAQKALRVMQAIAEKETDNRRLRSGLHLAQGMIAQARGDGNAAVRHLSLCDENNVYCRYRLALAQEKFGDAAGAAATKAKLKSSVRREMLYVYVSAKLGLLRKK